MYTTALITALLSATAFAAPVEQQLEKRACPGIHIFGARETTASPGYGSAGAVVNKILAAHSGSTAEAISYPACGGGSACGGVSYSNSVQQGTTAVVAAVSKFAKSCPSTEIVLVGYSQGSEIFDNALCGNGDPKQGLSASAAGSIASYNIKAAIFMGDPRFEVGAPYNVGTCKAGGFSSRPSGQTCGNYNSKIQSYCDAADPYCCNGNNAATHNGYASEYGSKALTFVNSKL
nr:Acetylxylan esterase 2 [Rachicladosporium sp. CCFEE 5018]OQO22420.1 Acetylxylan esterase 2 [Rachicladosporium sp. CCFEE 5018]